MTPQRLWGRHKRPRLEPPPGLTVGIVNKMTDGAVRLFRVRRHALFGRLRDVRQRVCRVDLGTDVNTSHVEGLNGTCRGCVSWLARQTLDVGRRRATLRSSLALWRDVLNWVRPHSDQAAGMTPAIAAGLATERWTVLRYVRCTPAGDDLARQVWHGAQDNLLTSAPPLKRRRKLLPSLRGTTERSFA